jgi:DHA1 family multidrug resistance protein-like MFS transporter
MAAIHQLRSGQMAYTGRINGDSVPDEDVSTRTQSISRIPSTAWEHRGHQFQGLTGVRINPEHGKDVNVIDWWDENDAEVHSRFHIIAIACMLMTG